MNISVHAQSYDIWFALLQYGQFHISYMRRCFSIENVGTVMIHGSHYTSMRSFISPACAVVLQSVMLWCAHTAICCKVRNLPTWAVQLQSEM